MMYAAAAGFFIGGVFGIVLMAVLVASKMEMPAQWDDADFYWPDDRPVPGPENSKPPERM